MNSCHFCQDNAGTDFKITLPKGEEEFVCSTCMESFYKYFKSGQAEEDSLEEIQGPKELILGYHSSKNVLASMNHLGQPINLFKNAHILKVGIRREPNYPNYLLNDGRYNPYEAYGGTNSILEFQGEIRGDEKIFVIH